MCKEVKKIVELQDTKEWSNKVALTLEGRYKGSNVTTNKMAKELPPWSVVLPTTARTKVDNKTKHNDTRNFHRATVASLLNSFPVVNKVETSSSSSFPSSRKTSFHFVPPHSIASQLTRTIVCHLSSVFPIISPKSIVSIFAIWGVVVDVDEYLPFHLPAPDVGGCVADVPSKSVRPIASTRVPHWRPWHVCVAYSLDPMATATTPGKTFHRSYWHANSKIVRLETN